jgi:hypothetical protein
MADNTSAGSVSAVPYSPESQPSNSPNNSVKVATEDVMIYSMGDLEVQAILDILFEDVSSQELISISRNDIVNGQDIKVQTIKNLKNLGLKYSSKNIISVPDTSYYFFNNFPISLEDYIPNQTSDIPLAEIDNEGNLVINFINVSNDEQVEVQVFSSGEIFDDTVFNGTI